MKQTPHNAHQMVTITPRHSLPFLQHSPLPVGLEIKSLRAHQSTLDSQARFLLSKPCHAPPTTAPPAPASGLRALETQRNVTPPVPDWCHVRNAHRSSMKGLLLFPLLSHFVPVEGKPSPQEKHGGFAHILLVSFSLFSLHVQRHMKEATSGLREVR